MIFCAHPLFDNVYYAKLYIIFIGSFPFQNRNDIMYLILYQYLNLFSLPQYALIGLVFLIHFSFQDSLSVSL